jgi:hypothetical protein
MASPTPQPPGPERPQARVAPRPPARRERVWAVGTLAGGLVLLLVALATMGAVDFYDLPVLGWPLP